MEISKSFNPTIFKILVCFFYYSPYIVYGNTQQNDHQPGYRVFRFGIEKVQAKERSKSDVNDGDDGITKGLVRSLRVRA